MYGMVNRAIVELISTRYGEAAWQEILQQSKVQHQAFISMEQYPDETSVNLLVAAAEHLDKSPAAVLEELGEYWIEFALKGDYGDLLRMAGDDLPEILMNLDNLHVRVGYSFPNLMPPSFWCTDVNEESLVLHYSSQRAGLAPMIIGLIKGLGRMLGTVYQVQQTAFQGHDEADHDEFLIQFARQPVADSQAIPMANSD